MTFGETIFLVLVVVVGVAFMAALAWASARTSD